jgi:pimeloyl-ACP methyl ester carboxylesterase
MKKITLLLVQFYFRMFSFLWPARAGAQAFRLFQKTRKLPMKAGELEFYSQAKKFEITHPGENILAYEMGDPQGPLVLLVHGWESNAGSMGAIARILAYMNFRVVALDLPAHGHSHLTHTNLRECREALRALVYHLQPTEPFSVVTHSFGSAVTTYALSGSDYVIDQFVMLTSPNRLIEVFDQFRQQINLGRKAYQYVLARAGELLQEPIEKVSVETKLQQLNYRKLTILHDLHDKVLPYSYSLQIRDAADEVTLHTLTNAGHYRMLWNPDLLKLIVNTLLVQQSQPANADRISA